jgi:hypothetical protein
MMPDLIPYLKKNNGRKLERIMPRLMLVDEKSRFDSERFDILACLEDRFIGIKEYRLSATLDKLAEDTGWIDRKSVV